MPEGTLREDCAQHKLRALPAWIIESHGKLTANNFLLFDVFILGKGRIHHRVGENGNRLGNTLRRNIDPIYCSIETRISVDIAAAILDLPGDVSRFAIPRAFEKHVFENVREARSHPFAFVDAPGGAPRLHTCDRRAVVFLNDQSKPILERKIPERRFLAGRAPGDGESFAGA